MALNMSMDVLLQTSSLSDSPWWLYIADGAYWTVGLAVSSFFLALVIGTIIGTLRTVDNECIRAFCEAWTVILLGWKKGTVSYVIYLLIGLVGVPVFSSFSAGPAKLFGPTGGYLIGFIFLAMISGWFIEKFPGKRVMYFVGMVLGTAVCYALGTAWLAYEAEMTFQAALMAGVIPFIIGDIAKMIVAIIVAPMIKNPLVKAGYIK